MRNFGSLGLLVLCLAASTARADVITDWNNTLITAIRADTTQPGPTFGSRNMAMVHAAMYDAVNSVVRDHMPMHVDLVAPAGTSAEAAAAQAAYRVLVNLYPTQQPLFDARLSASLSGISGAALTQGVALGNTVGNEIVTWRSTDHAHDPMPYTPGTAPGQWRPDPLHPTQTALGAGWGNVTPFAIAAANQFHAPAPPALNSAEYAAAFNEVKAKGRKTGSTRTADETEIGIFWGYDIGGMGPPPVLYNQITQTIAANQGNSMVENARLFALVNTAMADAGIAAWETKYSYHFWRPIAGIREAAADSNPLTDADEFWEPLGAPGPDPFTPPFPAYVSGHATFGAALFRTLGNFYGADNIAFTIGSDELPGVFRSYTSFSQAAAENGISRIYLGIHWDYDNTEGQAMGVQVADYVFGHSMQAVPEPATWVLAGLGAAGLIAARRRHIRGRRATS